jgi:membrane protein YdbS with pleckstrin-like domain
VGLVLGLLLLDLVDVVPSARVRGLFKVLEAVGVVAFIAQLPCTFLMLRLDYRYRWYMVTDTTLRIREGLLRVREQTMTFANIQNLSIKQGPLQRLFGISDLQVRTAGGGGEHSGEGEELSEADNMHLSFFRGVSNADEIRDLVMDRMRGLRDTGLGDPDEVERRSPAPDQDIAARMLGAARELLAETRRLRGSLTA